MKTKNPLTFLYLAVQNRDLMTLVYLCKNLIKQASNDIALAVQKLMENRVFVILMYLCKSSSAALRKFTVCVTGLAIRIRTSNVSYSTESLSHVRVTLHTKMSLAYLSHLEKWLKLQSTILNNSIPKTIFPDWLITADIFKLLFFKKTIIWFIFIDPCEHEALIV